MGDGGDHRPNGAGRIGNVARFYIGGHCVEENLMTYGPTQTRSSRKKPAESFVSTFESLVAFIIKPIW